jgi:hypothetical protein
MIPPFDRLDYPQPLNSDQEAFVDHSSWRWEQGEAIDLGSKVGYLYEYLRRNIKEPRDVIKRVPRLLST